MTQPINSPSQAHVRAQRRHSAPARTKLLIAVALLGFFALSCKGGVEHPPAGQPNSAKYCADRDSAENNCNACSSQPGCGWCQNPQEGSSHCQPGTSDSAPGSCVQGWAFNTDSCATPPPPPPPQ